MCLCWKSTCVARRRAVLQCVSACSSFVCPPCSSCVRVCCCFSRGACWIELGARAAWFMCLSVSSVVALPWFCVGCLHDGRGDGAQTWHVVWGLLLAACVLRCVAKIVMVEWQTCMMFMCACVHHVLVLEIDLCGSTARCFAGRKCLLLFLCVLRAVRVCVCAVVSRVACWIELGARAAWFMCLSVASVVSSLSVVLCGLCMMVAVMEHKRWHVVWGLLAACVLRFCVALRCENRNG